MCAHGESLIQWQIPQQEKLSSRNVDNCIQRAKHKENRHVERTVCEPFRRALQLSKEGRAEL